MCTINDSRHAELQEVAAPRSRLKPAVPQLLVSVRNVEEAVAAIHGGCDILDVKEPSRGSLGMASVDTLQQIVKLARQHHPQRIVTAALGEVHEYATDSISPLPAELNLVKIGCARLGTTPQWREDWHCVRRLVSRALSPATGWVAVAYADWQLALAPPPHEIVAEALSTGCRGVLFDTYAKSGRRLLDSISIVELQEIAERLHAAGLFLALAGSLRLEDLPALRPVPSDIIAIRGAACLGGLRTDAIQESAVREFLAAMHSSQVDAPVSV